MSSIQSQPRRTSLRDAVQDHVQNYIIGNQHRPGDLLPPEAQLARQLGVSRSSLREAIRALQVLGVVESRHGSGTYVGSFRMDTLLEGMAFSIRTSTDVNALRALREVLEVRTVLERHMIRQVALTCTDAQIADLERLIDRMATSAEAGRTFAEEDAAFHEALYETLDNGLFVQLVRTFWQLFESVENRLRTIDHELHTIVEVHQRVVEALRNHDPDAAEIAMTQHLDGIHDRVSNAEWV